MINCTQTPTIQINPTEMGGILALLLKSNFRTRSAAEKKRFGFDVELSMIGFELTPNEI
jgi:hypothetical protein